MFDDYTSPFSEREPNMTTTADELGSLSDEILSTTQDEWMSDHEPLSDD